MEKKSLTNTVIGVLVLLFAVLCVFVWIPLDTQSGLIEKVRGRQAIGDALAPTLACGFLIFGGVMLLLFERNATDQPTVSRAQAGFIARMVGVIVFGILVMRWTGPALAELVSLFRPEPIENRLLRGTAGGRHVGFVLGGVIIVAGMITIVEHKFTRRALLTALIAVSLFIAIFDIPFEDLLLPPNGDV